MIYTPEEMQKVADWANVPVSDVTPELVVDYKCYLFSTWEKNQIKCKNQIPFAIRKEIGLFKVIFIAGNVRFEDENDMMVFKIKYGDMCG